MEKKIIKKIARYVELSAKFSKSDRDIFTDEEFKTLNKCSGNGITISPYTGTIIMGGSGIMGHNIVTSNSTTCLNGTVIVNGKEVCVDENGNVKAMDKKKPLTRGKLLEANTLLEVKVRAILLDEYDEYTKLRTLLNNYFSGVDKLIND